MDLEIDRQGFVVVQKLDGGGVLAGDGAPTPHPAEKGADDASPASFVFNQLPNSEYGIPVPVSFDN